MNMTNNYHKVVDDHVQQSKLQVTGQLWLMEL